MTAGVGIPGECCGSRSITGDASWRWEKLCDAYVNLIFRKCSHQWICNAVAEAHLVGMPEYTPGSPAGELWTLSGLRSSRQRCKADRPTTVRVPTQL